MAYLFPNMKVSHGTEWTFTRCRENAVLMANNVGATIAVEKNKEKPRTVSVKPD